MGVRIANPEGQCHLNHLTNLIHFVVLTYPTRASKSPVRTLGLSLHQPSYLN